MARYVISLGGNALGNTPQEQQLLLKNVAQALVPIIKANHDLIIVHGNGPQVGMINLAFTESIQTPMMPFAECGAMSQGYIGYHIQNALKEALETENIAREVVALVTQVEIDANDPAFNHPTKPIGQFYTKEEAKEQEAQYGYVFVEDAGRGYRRVIASPNPINILEKASIEALLQAHHIVIASGGGGIPVVKKGKAYQGIDAVIDKDHASALMASILSCDELIILTAVNRVMLHFNQPNQQALEEVTLNQLETYIAQGHFKKGSMLPKIEACMAFTDRTGNPSLIAHLNEASLAFNGKSGTKIIKA